MKKAVFFAIWLILLVLVPITILKITPVTLMTKYPSTLMNVFERAAGLILFVLLFVQIILGERHWFFKFHVFEGRLIYFFAFLHPIFYIAQRYFDTSKIDPYSAFINICLMCQTPSGLFISFGRIAFWLLTITVLAAVFRNATPWLRANWRKLHVINYAIFLLVGAHGFLVGTDFRTQPFYAFAILAYAIVAGIIVFIELPRLYRNFKEWVKS